jgi:NOL1/NOP2/sun family putative RNA methylase
LEYIESIKKAASFVRINTLKTNIEDYLVNTELELEQTKIPFMFKVRNGNPGKTISFKTGLIHTQSLSSAIVPLAFGKFDQKDAVLDIAASPGSKLTQICMLMDNKGIVVANDQEERIPALMANIARLGCTNTIITMLDGKRLGIKEHFDKVLLDAPCTALGSHAFAWERINDKSMVIMPDIQKKMIKSAFEALKPGGILVYSTCTVTQQENEAVVNYLLKNNENARLESIDLDLPHEQGFAFGDFSDEIKKKTWRILPKHLESEGFFIAKIRKMEI